MGWSIGYDNQRKRDIGYGVPATCDQPGCGREIDRGLSYVCGSEPLGGESGCGLYFCAEHLRYDHGASHTLLCERCLASQEPFTPTPDTAEWNRHKLTDPSWAEWREKFPDEVERLQAAAASKAEA